MRQVVACKQRECAQQQLLPWVGHPLVVVANDLLQEPPGSNRSGSVLAPPRWPSAPSEDAVAAPTRTPLP
eukprot:scaffold85229_cov63-Phaeocystis_antarctica.AAC.7